MPRPVNVLSPPSVDYSIIVKADGEGVLLVRCEYVWYLVRPRSKTCIVGHIFGSERHDHPEEQATMILNEQLGNSRLVFIGLLVPRAALCPPPLGRIRHH